MAVIPPPDPIDDSWPSGDSGLLLKVAFPPPLKPPSPVKIAFFLEVKGVA
jgi:hypothetical protein